MSRTHRSNGPATGPAGVDGADGHHHHHEGHADHQLGAGLPAPNSRRAGRCRRHVGRFHRTHHPSQPTPPPRPRPGPATAHHPAGSADANVAHLLRPDRHRHRSRGDGCTGGGPPVAPAVSPQLALATLAVGQPMGQQVYERELAGRAAAELGPDWSVDRIVVRTLRSPLAGTVRVPSRLLIDASPALRRTAGRFLYRGQGIVHRMDLRLPPAPRPEVLTVHDVVPLAVPRRGPAAGRRRGLGPAGRRGRLPVAVLGRRGGHPARRGRAGGHPQRGRASGSSEPRP